MIQDKVSEWVLLKDGRHHEKFRTEEILMQTLNGFFATQAGPIQTIIVAISSKEGARSLGLSNMLLYMATIRRSILFKGRAINR